MTRHACRSVPGQQIFEPLLSWLHKRQASHTWNQTVLTGRLVQQETSKRKVVQHFLTRHASTSAPGQQMFEPLFFSCWSLVEQVCLSKLFGSMCDLVVSCATTREVVHIFVDPAGFYKRAGSTKCLNQLCQQILFHEWFKCLLGRHTG